MTRTRPMNADEVERILERYGFVLISQKGSPPRLSIGCYPCSLFLFALMEFINFY
jgi:hypothetical protein